ncbi:MAG TPA: hypothetical protein PKH39_19140 [Woeseiaceae bacterium]|nr:hypothetical protein [Woeseiaceae bacterium]
MMHSAIRAVGFLLVMTCSLPVYAQASSGGIDQELYDRFLSMRIGDGEPVFWYFIGTSKAYPSGELLSVFEGIDIGRRVTKPDEPDVVYQLSRKIYIHREPETGQVIEEMNGKPVPVTKYPYQLIRYQLVGDELAATVEQGRRPNLRTIGPVAGMTARRIGNVAQYSAPLFIAAPLPEGGVIEHFENYDFFAQPDSVDKHDRYQLSWVGYGHSPPLNNGGPVLKHLVAWRTDSFEGLPDSIKQYVRKQAPLWMEPPKDFEEIYELQKAHP